MRRISPEKIEGSFPVELFDCTQNRALQLYRCDICGTEVFFKINLKLHMDIYHNFRKQNHNLTTEKLYLICDSRYNISNILRCYSCDKCDFSTYSFLVLLNHKNHKCKGKFRLLRKEEERYRLQPILDDEHVLPMKYHRIIREIMQSDVEDEVSKFYECSQCIYKTKSKSYLEYHMNSKHRSDAEAEWFHCAECPYKTKNKPNLSKHYYKSHAGKPKILKHFSCKQCNYKTSNTKNVNRHMRERHMDPTFLCELCAYRCSRSINLKRHLQRMHLRCVKSKMALSNKQ